MNKSVKKFLNPVLIAGLSASSIGAVNAQVLEEIVVTAQKREQSIQDIGLSVRCCTFCW